MSLPFKSQIAGKFSKALEERIAKWAKFRSLGAKISIPPDMEWLYWQEFGTPPYDINPKNKPEMVFPQHGELQFRKDTVKFPGLKPRRSITKTIPEIRTEAADTVREHFQAGAFDDPASLQEALHDLTQKAKDQIAQTISKDLPGLRDLEPEFGRLHGRTAAEAFTEEAQVKDLNEA